MPLIQTLLQTSSYIHAPSLVMKQDASTFGVALIVHHLLCDGHRANDVITTAENMESESDTLMSLHSN